MPRHECEPRGKSRKGHKWLPTASKCCLHQTMERELREAIGTQSPNSILLHWPKGRASNSINSTQMGTRFPIHQQENPCQMAGPWISKPERWWGATSPDPSPRTQRDQGHHIGGRGPPTIGFLKSNRPSKTHKSIELDFRKAPAGDKSSRIRDPGCP